MSQGTYTVSENQRLAKELRHATPVEVTLLRLGVTDATSSIYPRLGWGGVSHRRRLQGDRID